MVDYQNGVELIENFVSNAIKIKDKEPDASVKSLYGFYNDTYAKASFGQGFFAFVPWIAFLDYDQAVQKGIYPLILFSMKKDKNNFEVCYGVSEANDPPMNWPKEIIKDKPFSNSGKFTKCYVSKVFTINTIEDFNKQKSHILDAINKVIEDFNKTFKKH